MSHITAKDVGDAFHALQKAWSTFASVNVTIRYMGIDIAKLEGRIERLERDNKALHKEARHEGTGTN